MYNVHCTFNNTYACAMHIVHTHIYTCLLIYMTELVCVCAYRHMYVLMNI